MFRRSFSPLRFIESPMLPDESSTPRILRRKKSRISPYVELVEKEVQFDSKSQPEVYHCLTQEPYVAMFVRTEDGQIPLVSQYRPAVEAYTWELPAGTLHPGETPEQAASRELLEETGLESTEVLYLGRQYPDTGRLQIDSHAFFMRARKASVPPPSEEGIVVQFVNHGKLRHMIATGEFRHSIHLAIYAAVVVRGIEID